MRSHLRSITQEGAGSRPSTHLRRDHSSGLLPSCASIALYNVFTVPAPQPTGDKLLTDDRGRSDASPTVQVLRGLTFSFAQNVAAPSGRSRGSKAATSPFCAHGNAGQMVG